jgi:hypothetical protein
MRLCIIPSAVAVVVVLGLTPAAALTGANHSVTTAVASQVVPTDYSPRRNNSRARRDSHARAPGYPHQGRVPLHLRGFEDPGTAYHGNINGCVIDQGYGRWAPCR